MIQATWYVGRYISSLVCQLMKLAKVVLPSTEEIYKTLPGVVALPLAEKGTVFFSESLFTNNECIL